MNAQEKPDESAAPSGIFIRARGATEREAARAVQGTQTDAAQGLQSAAAAQDRKPPRPKYLSKRATVEVPKLISLYVQRTSHFQCKPQKTIFEEYQRKQYSSRETINNNAFQGIPNKSISFQ